MNVIKVNYNNAFVRKPANLYPYVYCYREAHREDDNWVTKKLFIRIDDRLDVEPFFTNYLFEIYVEGTLVAYMDISSNKIIELEDSELYDKRSFFVDIKGYYYNDMGHRFDMNTIRRIVQIVPICSQQILCSEHIFCDDIIEGYFHNDKFYATKELVTEIIDGTPVQTYQYSNEITDENVGKYYDRDTGKIYVYGDFVDPVAGELNYCRPKLLCGELLRCYYHEGKLYYDKIESDGEFIYENEVADKTRRTYYDIDSGNVYIIGSRYIEI